MFNNRSEQSSPLKQFELNSQEMRIDELKQSRNSENKDELLDDIYKRYIAFKKKMLKTRCLVAWKYHLKYEKSMTLKSSPIAHHDDQFELSNSSFLNLSSSKENETSNQDDLDITEQPNDFKEEYGEIKKKEIPTATDSH
mmetsp:Transcript_4343/g.3644  ORF Transcript_4343/g.3644 Transcript_4343/m.3644 type:complete len:140 (-) Transcript_4343:74-493(-)